MEEGPAVTKGFESSLELERDFYFSYFCSIGAAVWC